MGYMEVLEKYLTAKEIKTLKKRVGNKYRGNILTDHYFVKMGKNISDYFYNSIVEEIELYNTNRNNPMFPTLIDSYVDEEVCVLILKRVNANILSTDRYNYGQGVSRSLRVKIAKQIVRIKDLNPNRKLPKNYNRGDKLLKYFNLSKTEMNIRQIDFIDKIFNVICNCEVEYVISHGDLMLPNIMIENKTIKFIDWEFIGYRPATFDLAYFMLFSKDEKCFELLDSMSFEHRFLKELYKDGIFICLKEISKLVTKKKNEKKDTEYLNVHIRRWMKELNILLEFFKY